MPKQPGLFDSFDNLDAISAESLVPFIKSAPTILQLENYLANRILYPGTLPITDLDMKIDLAILREALRINGPKSAKSGNPLLGDNPFLNETLRKIIIPERFLHYVPDLVSISWAFLDGLLLRRIKQDQFEDIWTVVVSADFDEIVGSAILLQFESLEESMMLSLQNRDYRILAGSLTLISCPATKCQITYEGKVVEVYGGRLGLMIDGRMR